MRYTLDSNVTIYEIDGKLATPLPTGTYFVSIISKIELLSFPGNTPEQEAAPNAVLGSATIVDLTPPVVDEAIRLRRMHRLRLPDAIIAATALVTDSELLTHDAGLLRLAGLKVSAPPLR